MIINAFQFLVLRELIVLYWKKLIIIYENLL